MAAYWAVYCMLFPRNSMQLPVQTYHRYLQEKWAELDLNTKSSHKSRFNNSTGSNSDKNSVWEKDLIQSHTNSYWICMETELPEHHVCKHMKILLIAYQRCKKNCYNALQFSAKNSLDRQVWTTLALRTVRCNARLQLATPCKLLKWKCL